MKNWTIFTTIMACLSGNHYLKVNAQTETHNISLKPENNSSEISSPTAVLAASNHDYHSSIETAVPFSLEPLKLSPQATYGVTIAVILQIILKLLIFKMIVKFMAFICALLYFPKTEVMMDKEDTTMKPQIEKIPSYFFNLLTEDPIVMSPELYQRMIQAVMTEPKT